jgi:hypothetical protein
VTRETLQKRSLHRLFSSQKSQPSAASSSPRCAMSFRLPTNPDAFIPPPSEQLTLARPWRGTFVYPQAQPSRNATLQEIFVTAAETEGDKYAPAPRSSDTGLTLAARLIAAWTSGNNAYPCM